MEITLIFNGLTLSNSGKGDIIYVIDGNKNDN